MKPGVVIVGGGFGGLEAAFSLKSLLRKPLDITLIDRGADHSFLPSIHLVVSGKVEPREIRIPLKAVLGAAGIRFIRDEALSVDREARRVVTKGGSFPYDFLLLSSGAENNFFSIPGAEEFSFPFRSSENAAAIRTRLLDLLDGPARPLRLAVAGAGTEGVEVTAELVDAVRDEGYGDELKAGTVLIEIIEGKKSVLPSFPLEVRNRAADYLRRQSVLLTAGERVAEVLKDCIVLASGQRRNVSLLIWASGIRPSKLIRSLDAPKDPWGWLKVTERLHVLGDARVFGIGDAVSIHTADGPMGLQRLAYHAIDQARVAALNIVHQAEGTSPVSYKPKNRPQLISLGKNMGIFATEERVFSGPWVVSLKKAVERRHLLTSLAKPLSTAVLARMPCRGFLHRIGTMLPL